VQRARWLTLGVVLGLGVGLGIPSLLAFDIPLLPRPAREWVVGGAGPERLATIGAALRLARPGDVVTVEPGVYAESIVLPDGVALVAREPGTAVLVAPPGQPGWTALTLNSPRGNRVSGVRVRGQPDAPVAIGVRLTGDNLVLEDVIVEGTLTIGVDVEREGTILVRGCRFSELTGVPVRIGNKAKPVIRQSLFVRSASAGPSAAIDVAAESRPELVDNLFVGYGDGVRVLAGPGMLNRSEELFRGNFRIRAGGAAH
jgi:hypothetical protein